MMMVPVVPVVSILAGVFILIFPKFLNYIVAFYLILVGIMGFLR